MSGADDFSGVRPTDGSLRTHREVVLDEADGAVEGGPPLRGVLADLRIEVREDKVVPRIDDDVHDVRLRPCTRGFMGEHWVAEPSRCALQGSDNAQEPMFSILRG